MRLLIGLAFVVLAVLCLRRVRWAYIAFVLLGLAYFPAKAGFRLEPRACQLVLDPRLAAASLTNVGHVVLFALFFLMTVAQLPEQPVSRGRELGIAASATIAMGVLVELAQGATGQGSCRLRDLIPDSAGILITAVAVMLWRRIRPHRRSREDRVAGHGSS